VTSSLGGGKGGDWENEDWEGYPRHKVNTARSLAKYMNFGLPGGIAKVGGLHDYLPPAEFIEPSETNTVRYRDLQTVSEVIEIKSLVVFWREPRELNKLSELRWVRVDNRGARYVNHVIKQVSGLLELKRMDQQCAEKTLDLLYAILESKL
jgi:hypothetical protein